MPDSRARDPSEGGDVPAQVGRAVVELAIEMTIKEAAGALRDKLTYSKDQSRREDIESPYP